jgi:hypothetical protein
MEITYILLINFTSKKEASEYFKNSGLSFAYECKNLFYDAQHNIIEEPKNHIKYNFGDIWIENNENPVASQLFIKDGFLSYFKEVVFEETEM